MTETMPRTSRTAAADYAAGLRALADFLERHADTLPEPHYLARLNVWHPASVDADCAIVATGEDDGLPVAVTPSSSDLDVITVRFGVIVAQGLVSVGRRAGEQA